MGKGEKLASAQMMSPMLKSGGSRADRTQSHLPRRRIDRTVDEEHGICVSDVFRQLRRPLLLQDDADSRLRTKPLLSPPCEPQPYAVVTAERISAPEYEAAEGHLTHPVPLRASASRDRATRHRRKPARQPAASARRHASSSSGTDRSCAPQPRHGSERPL